MYPHERSLVKRHSDDPFVLFGISLERTPEQLRDLIEREEFTWPIIYERDRVNTAAYDVVAIPAIYLIDHEGVVRFKHIRDTLLNRAIRKLLREVPK